MVINKPYYKYLIWKLKKYKCVLESAKDCVLIILEDDVHQTGRFNNNKHWKFREEFAPYVVDKWYASDKVAL